MRRIDKTSRIIEIFQKENPHPKSELKYNNPYELLVAVILSAQCTDKRVNMTTSAFFAKYPTAQALSIAEFDNVYNLIKSISYPNNKARNLIAMAKDLVSLFDAVVPDDVDELQKLPGVGRKTANVVASVVFNKPALAVDTHVFRVAARIGLTSNAKNPLQTEQQLLKLVPTDIIPDFHHWMILHGRYVCKAHKPLCQECKISDYCSKIL